MNLDGILEVFRNVSLAEIDTFEAALAVESAIEELRDINAALYEAGKRLYEAGKRHDELAASLEWALDRIRSAGLGEGEKFAAAEAVLVKAVHS